MSTFPPILDYRLRPKSRVVIAWVLPLFCLGVFIALSDLAIPGNEIGDRLFGRSHCTITGAALAQISMTKQSLQNFEVDFDRFPTTREGLYALTAQPPGVANWHPFMDNYAIDPWGHPLMYKCPGTADPSSYDLYSCGPDGIDGTSDDLTKDQL
jgi:general secretion pathway protein G